MAKPQALAHDLAPQIQVAVLEADFFTDRLVELEGKRFRAVQKLELPGEQLDAPGSEIRVLRSSRSGTHQPAHANDELIPELACLLEHPGGIRIENDLQQPF